MILERISIVNYRNIEEATLEFSPGVNCFVGANGMGKTNLLDAVYYLSFCKSASNPQDAANIRHGAGFFLLQGSYRSEEGTEANVSCAVKAGSPKRVKWDDKPYRRLAEHVGKIPLVMISPSDSALVGGASEERRRFMDVVISQHDAAYLDSLVRYGRTLQQRNALLRREEEPDWNLMSVLEEMMAQDAALIYQRRAAFVEDFRPVFREIYSGLCNGAAETVDIEYASHGARGDLLPQLRDGRAKERIVGYTLHGVHKDELQLLFNGFPVKREGSQGQMKTYFIAMKLAQYLYLKERGERRTPLLLMDDIFDKLDAGRVGRIIDYVSGSAFGQLFITDTNRSHLDLILGASACDYRLFNVKDGKVS